MKHWYKQHRLQTVHMSAAATTAQCTCPRTKVVKQTFLFTYLKLQKLLEVCFLTWQTSECTFINTGWRKKNACFWYLPAISLFWVTSNQKSTFENLVQSTIWKFSIREEIVTVPQEMLVNVMQNFEERLRTCVRQEGPHLSDIIFCNWVINVSNQNCVYYRLFWC